MIIYRLMSIRSISMGRINHEKIIFIVVATCLVLISGVGGGRAIADLEIRRQLKHLNKPAVKSIKSEDGDIIDCVDIYNQLAFDHPLLKNHTIQMRPSNSDGEIKSSSKLTEQLWHKSGSCPEGTIPVLRTRKSDLLRMVNLENSNAHVTESAKLYAEHENHGGEAVINVWNINVEPKEWSTASILVSKRATTDMITAGWIVNPTVFGDNKTRLYAYWTSEYGGCYNLKCPGFIQTSQKTCLGVEISPVSTYGGNQYSFHMMIYKDLNHDNWWFYYNNVAMGYWPGTLMTKMAESADHIEWGGKILRTAPAGTKTQMGSGHFPKEGEGKAAFINNCVFYHLYETIVPINFPTTATKPSCYDISAPQNVRQQPGASFYYGGPGGPDCVK